MFSTSSHDFPSAKRRLLNSSIERKTSLAIVRHRCPKVVFPLANSNLSDSDTTADARWMSDCDTQLKRKWRLTASSLRTWDDSRPVTCLANSWKTSDDHLSKFHKRCWTYESTGEIASLRSQWQIISTTCHCERSEAISQKLKNVSKSCLALYSIHSKAFQKAGWIMKIVLSLLLKDISLSILYLTSLENLDSSLAIS